MKPKLIAGGVVVLAVVLAALWVLRAVEAQRPKGTDEDQIRTLLMEAEAAAERGDSAGLTRYISESYRDNIGFSETSVKWQIRDYMRRFRFQEIVIPAEAIRVNVLPDGLRATAQFPLRGTVQGPSGTSSFQLDMTLSLAREPVYYFWIFPGAEWRITSAEGYADLPSYY